MTILDEFLSPTEAAHQLGLSTCRVRQLMAAGQLDHVRTAIGRLVKREAVVQLAERRQQTEDRRVCA